MKNLITFENFKFDKSDTVKAVSKYIWSDLLKQKSKPSDNLLDQIETMLNAKDCRDFDKEKDKSDSDNAAKMLVDNTAKFLNLVRNLEFDL